MRKIFLALLTVVLVSGLIFGSCTAPAAVPGPGSEPTATPEVKPIELTFSCGVPAAGAMVKQVHIAWLHEIEERTAAIGKPVKFTVYSAGALAKIDDQYDLAVNGVADIVGVWGPAHFQGRMPLLEVLQLPCLFPSAEVACEAAHELVIARPEIQKEVSEAKLLFFNSTAAAGINTRTKQIKTLDDFKGMKVASRPGMTAEIIKALGAVPVPQSPVDTYAALERGVVDAVTMNWDGTMAFKYHDVTKYRTDTPSSLYNDPLATSMSWDSWNKLPPEVQEIIDELSGVPKSKLAGETNDKTGADILALIEEYDKKVGNPPLYMVPNDEYQRWVEAITPVYDKWIADVEAKGLPGKAVFEELRGIISKYQ